MAAEPPNERPEDPFFATEHLRGDLRRRSVRGGAVTIVAQALRFFVQMGSTVVLARLLDPSEHGLVGMITALTVFLLHFKDLGLSMATVQKREITREQVSTLFWINVGLGVAFMAITAVAAPAMAAFYGDGRLVGIALGLSVGFLFAGFGVQHNALLLRQMRYKAVAGAEVGATAISVAAAIVAASLGAGYWALVVMHSSLPLAQSAIVWILCRWLPGPPVRGSGAGSMLRFGGNLALFNGLHYFARNIDNVLIGWRWGAAWVGLYGKAYGLLLQPLRQINAPVTNVAIPALSRLQDDPERYARFYRRAINLVLYLTLPLIVGLLVLSDEIILLLLGANWAPAGLLFRILAIAALTQPLANTTGWVFISLGQTNRMFRWALFSVPVTVAAFAIGLPWGAKGVAAGYAVSAWITAPILVWYAYRRSPIRLGPLARAALCPTVVGAVVFAVAFLVREQVADRGAVATILVTFAAGAAAAGATALLWPRCRNEMRSLLPVFRELRGRAKTSPGEE